MNWGDDDLPVWKTRSYRWLITGSLFMGAGVVGAGIDNIPLMVTGLVTGTIALARS